MLSAGEIERWIWRVFKLLDAFRLDDLMIRLFLWLLNLQRVAVRNSLSHESEFQVHASMPLTVHFALHIALLN